MYNGKMKKNNAMCWYCPYAKSRRCAAWKGKFGIGSGMVGYFFLVLLYALSLCSLYLRVSSSILRFSCSTFSSSSRAAFCRSRFSLWLVMLWRSACSSRASRHVTPMKYPTGTIMTASVGTKLRLSLSISMIVAGWSCKVGEINSPLHQPPRYFIGLVTPFVYAKLSLRFTPSLLSLPEDHVCQGSRCTPGYFVQVCR